MSIMAHPSRETWVDELRGTLGDIPVAWDQRNDEWDTGSRAWQLSNSDTNWHVVIQDDALVPHDFVDQVATALAIDHDGPVSFYLGTGRPRQTAVRQAVARATDGWVRMPWLLWGVAFALPTHRIPDMLNACATGAREYDKRISDHFVNQAIETRYVWPPIVDHRDEGSLLGHDTGVERRAWHCVHHVTPSTATNARSTDPQRTRHAHPTRYT